MTNFRFKKDFREKVLISFRERNHFVENKLECEWEIDKQRSEREGRKNRRRRKKNRTEENRTKQNKIEQNRIKAKR